MLKSLQKRWYYVGSTNRLKERINEHGKGKVFATNYYRPLKLVFIIKFDTEEEARKYEKRLKKRRIEKEELIRKIENNYCGVV